VTLGSRFVDLSRHIPTGVNGSAPASEVPTPTSRRLAMVRRQP